MSGSAHVLAPVLSSGRLRAPLQRPHVPRHAAPRTVSAAPAREPRLAAAPHPRRPSKHVDGPGVRSLAALPGLRALTLGCPAATPARLADALAALTQLTALDLTRCDAGLLPALGPLRGLVAPPGRAGGGRLRALSLSLGFEERQLSRGVAELLAGAAAAAAAVAEAEEEARAASGRAESVEAGLQTLKLHAHAPLPPAVADSLAVLRQLRQLSLQACGRPPAGALAAAASCLTRLTSLALMLPSAGNEGAGAEPQGPAAQAGAAAAAGLAAAAAAADGAGAPLGLPGGAQGQAAAAAAATAAAPEGAPASWLDCVGSWRGLGALEVSDDAAELGEAQLAAWGGRLHALRCELRVMRGVRPLHDCGPPARPLCVLRVLRVLVGPRACTPKEGRDVAAASSHRPASPCRTLTLRRAAGVSGGAGFAAWPGSCQQLACVALHELPYLGDAALAHLARLPALTRCGDWATCTVQ